MVKYIGTVTTKVVIVEKDIQDFFRMMASVQEDMQNLGSDYGEAVTDVTQEIEDNDE
jgi:hypothetical protein